MKRPVLSRIRRWQPPLLLLTVTSSLLLMAAAEQSKNQFSQDVMGDIAKGFNHFVATGQVWAMVIGVVLGYMLRSLTAF